MSAQFGRWNFDGSPVPAEYLARALETLLPYGPDGHAQHAADGVNILRCAFHTTSEPRSETQPFVSCSGSVFTWEGRLDNGAALASEMSLLPDTADVKIIAEAFDRWGVDCFAKILGDWALTIWKPREHVLLLAKDFLGSRPLFYSTEPQSVIWSTFLEALVLARGRSWRLEEEYLAGCLSQFPAPHLTPYVGIHSVPPASYVLLRPGKITVHRYWQFSPERQIRYRSDAEYESHFRAVFAQAVRRRLRSHVPILAELSGGMDSSSIVCVADDLIRDGSAAVPRLDTVSYFDNSEPNWNETPYLAEVEKRRGRTGCHIKVGAESSLGFPLRLDYFAATPGAIGSTDSAANEFASLLASSGYRIILSGIGGDETTGGVPTPLPELCDLLAQGKVMHLAHKLKLWALSKRRPWSHLFAETVRAFLPSPVAHFFDREAEFSWLDARFSKRNHAVLHGYTTRVTLFGPLPSFQENLATLDSLRRQLTSFAPSRYPRYEKRYPFLDRDLLEFLYAVPREQILRPGERRSLLRRALRGIVPDQILNRRRKAFVDRGLIYALSAQRRALGDSSYLMARDRLGILDQKIFFDLLQVASDGKEVPGVPLLRVLSLEWWLRHLETQNVLDLDRTFGRSRQHGVGNSPMSIGVRT
jgi:asparagine synthase (glutamine-hydrolysing)